jgi:S-methylmethionine-dependent homocysteine/selenocysteine methylase
MRDKLPGGRARSQGSRPPISRGSAASEGADLRQSCMREPAAPATAASRRRVTIVSEFVTLVESGRPILTDGGIETRIMFETDLEMDPDVQVAAMVFDSKGGPALRSIYASYIAAAREFELPVVIGTPTFRASPNFVRRAGLGGEDEVRKLNAGAARMHRELREHTGEADVFIAGVIGPSGDAYTPGEALHAADAASYHRTAAEALAGAGVDFLFAPTFPAVEEALGAALAMGATGLPYVVSFVLGHEGRVLDGTRLADAVARIDEGASPRPLYYSISCVYPTVAERALAAADGHAERIAELKANGSPLPTAELVRLDHLETAQPDEFAELLWSVHRAHPSLRVLGGCCGTDDRHMRALGELMARDG